MNKLEVENWVKEVLEASRSAEDLDVMFDRIRESYPANGGDLALGKFWFNIGGDLLLVSTDKYKFIKRGEEVVPMISIDTMPMDADDELIIKVLDFIFYVNPYYLLTIKNGIDGSRLERIKACIEHVIRSRMDYISYAEAEDILNSDEINDFNWSPNQVELTKLFSDQAMQEYGVSKKDIKIIMDITNNLAKNQLDIDEMIEFCVAHFIMMMQGIDEWNSNFRIQVKSGVVEFT